jgi:hypothetical protein
LVVRAELEAARELAAFGNKPATVRLQEQEIAEIIWALNWLLRLTAGFPKGKTTRPMKPHHERAVRECGVESTQNLEPVTGLEPLIDMLSFQELGGV